MVRKQLAKIVAEALPWGGVFASRSNYEWGYFESEKIMIEKYLPAKSSLLILGSGNGREAKPICCDGHRIVCMDYGYMYLEVGKRLFSKEKIDRTISFVAADVLHPLPFKGGAFDSVFFSIYSSCGEKRFDIMRDIRHILKPDGILFLNCANSLYPSIYPPEKDFSKYAFIDSEEELHQEVSQCGFDIIESMIDPDYNEHRYSVLKIGDYP